MKKAFIKYIRPIIQNIGFDIVRHENTRETLIDVDEQDDYILGLVKEYTMTSPERVLSLIEAIKYMVRNKIEGNIVECGVWNGGSCMTMVLALLNLDVKDREIFLYDTF